MYACVCIFRKKDEKNNNKSRKDGDSIYSLSFGRYISPNFFLSFLRFFHCFSFFFSFSLIFFYPIGFMKSKFLHEFLPVLQHNATLNITRSETNASYLFPWKEHKDTANAVKALDRPSFQLPCFLYRATTIIQIFSPAMNKYQDAAIVQWLSSAFGFLKSLSKISKYL